MLGKWAMDLMLLNVSTRGFGRAVRLLEGDVPEKLRDSRSKSAVSRRFVELSAERMAVWMSSDLSQLDLLAIQIDRLHIRWRLSRPPPRTLLPCRRWGTRKFEVRNFKA